MPLLFEPQKFPDQPNLSKVCKMLLLLQLSSPSSAAEHVFSILSNSLSILTIQDYIETSVMLQYYNINLIE